MELIIALIIFGGMIGCWLALPGTSEPAAAPPKAAPAPTVRQGAAEQPI